jgi:hypothetical protein
MSVLEVNEHGVPRYPKGHAGRLLVTLAAIDKLEHPTASSIAALTGLGKGNIDTYVRVLNAEFGTEIVKTDSEYAIQSWGDILKRSGVKTFLNP